MTKCMPKIVVDSDITQEGEVGKMDTNVGDAETPDRQHQDKILEKWVESCEKIHDLQQQDKIHELQQRIDSNAKPGKTQEGEAGDSMASIELPQSPEAEKTTNEEIPTLNLEDVAVECQNQQDAKRIIDDLRNKIEQLEAANSRLQNGIDEISTTLRNTNLEVESLNEALKAKEAAYALQTLSAQNVLHDTEETESLISQPVSLLPEQQDQSQLEAQKSELEREVKELLEQSHQSQKEIDYLQDRHNELIEMIKTAKAAHKEKEEGIGRDIRDLQEELGVINRCIMTWSDRMLILEEDCRQMKETAEPIIYSVIDAVLRLESEVVERFRNIQMRLLECRNELQTEKAELALRHKNPRLEIENNEIWKELQTMDLNVLELCNERRELKANLNDEERIKRMLAILCSRNDDSEIQEGGVDDVVASGDICQSEEAKKTTDKEILQTLPDENALNLEDVAITSEKQQGSKKIMDVLRSEIEQLEPENMRLQIGIDKMSNMVIETNLEVDKSNEALKAMEGSGEFVRAVRALQSLSARDVLHETEEAETLISSLDEKEIDKLRAWGNALIEMTEAAKTACGKKIQGTLGDTENCEQECKVHKQCIQRCLDRARTLEEELRQMKEITMSPICSLHDELLRLKLEVEEKFRNMQMRLSACREELEKQKAELMTVHHENQKCSTMSHKMKSKISSKEMKSKMKRELQNMDTLYLVMLEEIEKSGKELRDMERVKKMEDVAESEKMLKELKMINKDLKKKMSVLKREKKHAMVLLTMQHEQYMNECRDLCQIIHGSHSIWERLRQMFR